MIEKLSYNQKKYGLIALGLLVAWLAWTFAFQKTANVYLQYRTLWGQLEGSQEMTFPVAYAQRKQVNLNKILNGYHADPTVFRDNLLYQAAYHARQENVKIIQVPASEIVSSSICLQRISFQGSYFGLVRLLSVVKRMKDIGGVRSVKIRRSTQSEKSLQPTMDVYFVCLGKKG